MPNVTKRKMAGGKHRKNVQSKKRKLVGGLDMPTAKRSKRKKKNASPSFDYCDGGDCGHIADEASEDPRELETSAENGTIESVEEHGIFLPLVNGNYLDQESAPGPSKKRTVDDAGLEECERINKRRSLDFRTNSVQISQVKNNAMRWHVLRERESPKLYRKFPEQYWVPNEWVESLDHR